MIHNQQIMKTAVFGSKSVRYRSDELKTKRLINMNRRIIISNNRIKLNALKSFFSGFFKAMGDQLFPQALTAKSLIHGEGSICYMRTAPLVIWVQNIKAGKAAIQIDTSDRRLLR